MSRCICDPDGDKVKCNNPIYPECRRRSYLIYRLPLGDFCPDCYGKYRSTIHGQNDPDLHGEKVGKAERVSLCA